MDFGDALKAMKSGKRIARKGWNGKGLFVYYVPAAKYKICVQAVKDIADENDMIQYEAYMAIKNIKGSISTWVPSVNDCLAEDWYVLD